MPQTSVPVSVNNVPVRQRTEKACDQCRRRKTKCDGKALCKSCTDIGLECGYGDRVKQAKGPQYVAELEHRLKKLEHSISTGSIATELESPAQSSTPRMVSSDPFSGSFSLHENSHSIEISSLRPSDGVTIENVLAEDIFPQAILPQPTAFPFGKSRMDGCDGSSLARPIRHVLDDSNILVTARVILSDLSEINYHARCAIQHLDLLDMDLKPTEIVPLQTTDYDVFFNEDIYSTAFRNDLHPLQTCASAFNEFVNPVYAFPPAAQQDQ